MTTDETKPHDLTDDEARALEATASESDWTAVCNAILQARGGQYAPDWFPRVVMSGFMLAKTAQFKSGTVTTKKVAPSFVKATLRTGVQVSRVLVDVYGVTMHALLAPQGADALSGMLMFYELAMKARDPRHTVWGDFGARLTALGLLDAHGLVPDELVPVVLASAEGEGLDLHWVNPLMPTAPAAPAQVPTV